VEMAKMNPSISVDLNGVRLKNPTILASGILGLSPSTLLEALKYGAGAVVTKSISYVPREGHPNPTILYLGQGFLNAVGLPNPGAEESARELLQVRKKFHKSLIISVYGYTPEEYVDAVKVLKQVKPVAFELNFSCPSVKEVGTLIGQNPDMVSEVVKGVKAVTDLPVFAKLTPNVTDIVELAKAAEEAGADAIVAINTVKAMAIDIDLRRPILANRFGGLSGPAIKPIGIGIVYELYENLKVPIIGVGGITTWKDAIEYILAGATAVEIGSALSLKGYKIFREINRGILKYLTKYGISNIKEIIGGAHV
jgi:dihydroorotate dehydrogenase (NAD+) catalytic subunit